MTQTRRPQPAQPAPPSRRSPTWPASRGRPSPASSTAPRGSAPTSGVDVQAAIDRLGYVPNRAARSLVTRRSDSIAVVITEPTGRLFTDPFFPRLLRGISAALAARDRQLVLLMPESAADEARTGRLPDRRPRRRRPAGQPPRRRPAARPARRRPASRSCSSGGRRRASTASYVDVDNRAGRPVGGRPPHRRRPAGHRHDRRPAGHGRRHRPPGAAIATPSPRPASALDADARGASATSPRKAAPPR